jgi:hypothetical protein
LLSFVMVVLVLVMVSSPTYVRASGYAQDVADGLEPRTAPLRIGKIKEIVILSQGLAEDKDATEPEGCEHFQLTLSEVSYYFRVARAITKRDYHHTIVFSPCGVRGRITFADGRTGQWGIQKYRGGVVVLSDKTEFYLYCVKRCGKKFR